MNDRPMIKQMAQKAQQVSLILVLLVCSIQLILVVDISPKHKLTEIMHDYNTMPVNMKVNAMIKLANNSGFPSYLNSISVH